MTRIKIVKNISRMKLEKMFDCPKSMVLLLGEQEKRNKNNK